MIVCIAVNGEKFLDLGPAMPNIELVKDIFTYYHIFIFHFHRSITFRVIVQKTQKHRNLETHTHTCQTLTSTL